MNIEFDCSICRQRAVIDEVEAPQAELLIDAWARSHAHTAAERLAYEETLRTMARDAREDDDDT